jgi:hypothetical protein
MGEPCGVPSSRSMSSEVKLLNLKWTVLSQRKDKIHRQISQGKPRECTRLTRQL